MLDDELTSPPDPQSIDPPVHTVAQELPFGKLTWENFERLCYRLARKGADVEHCARFGQQGEAQGGIDIFVRRPEGRYDCWQVKRHKRFTANDLVTAVDTFLAGEWVGKTDTFVLAVQASLSGKKIQQQIEDQAASLRERGMIFLAWGADELTEQLRSHRELVREFFGAHWERAFFPAGAECRDESEASALFGPDRLAETITALTRFNLDRLEAARLYRPDQTIARAGFERALCEFEKAPQAIMPLIDRSGVGKTSMLALAAAGTEGSQMRLLLRGADISSGQDDLPAMIAALCRQCFSIPQGVQESLIDTIRHLPERLEQPLLILLDGLNEQTGPFVGFKAHWLPSSLEWLRRGPIKLLVSCRPEFWDIVRESWPSKLLYPAVPERVEADLPQADDRELPKREDAAPPASESVRQTPWQTQLGDFTPEEAKTAIEVYGLQDALRAEDAAHPFILAVAETLNDAGENYTDLARVLTRFVDRKIRDSIGRSGMSVPVVRVSSAVRTIAAEMLDRDVQVAPSDRIDAMFADERAVLDGLIDEHLLVLDAQGYRFQFDQVRELLQSMDLAARDVLAEITLLPEIPDRHWLYPLGGRVFVEIFLYSVRAWRRAAVEKRAPRLSSSTASFVMLRLLAEGDVQGVGILCERLFRATVPDRTDRGAAWAGETIQLFFERMSGDALSDPALLAWLERFVRRPDDYRRSSRKEEILRSGSRALARSSLSVEKRLAFVPWFMAEESPNWEGSHLSNTAFWERYGEAKNPRTLVGRHPMSATAGLLAALAACDGPQVMPALVGWLAEPLQVSDRPKGLSPTSSDIIAADCLYYLRAGHERLVCKAALQVDSAVAGFLREAMAIAEPDAMIAACLEDLPAQAGPLFDRVVGALWICGRHVVSDESWSDLLDFAERSIERPASPQHLWGARILLQQHDRLVGQFTRYPEQRWPLQMIQRLDPALQRAFDIVVAAIRSGSADMKEDYATLLRHAFDYMIDDLRDTTSDDLQHHPLLLPSLLGHLSAPALRTGRATHEAYARLVNLLAHLRRTCGEEAATRIERFAVGSASEVGLNPNYYLTAEDVERIGLVDLAVEAIEDGNAAVFEQCRDMRMPGAGPVRDRIIDALANSRISDDDAREMIETMAKRSHEPDLDGWFTALMKLRTPDRAEVWDQAMLKFLMIGSTESRQQLQRCVDLWQQTDRDALPAVTREFFDWLDFGFDAPEAARTLHATAYYKQWLRDERAGKTKGPRRWRRMTN